MSDHVCGNQSCHEQRRLLRTSVKELILRISLEKVTKPTLKSLNSTNAQSDRLCTNGGYSRQVLPSREVVDRQNVAFYKSPRTTVSAKYLFFSGSIVCI